MAGRQYWADPAGIAWRRLGESPLNNRSGLVYGAYLPDLSTTGLVSATTSTQATNVTYSDMTGTVKVFENIDYQGYVYITGKHYRFRNCRFSGPLSPTSAAVQCRYQTSQDIIFEDCTFKPRSFNTNAGNIIGRGFTLLRCDLSGGIDGAGPSVADGDTRTDVVIQQCYIHDLLRYCPDGSHSDNQSHSDGIQWAGGLGLTLLGNRIEGLLDTSIGDGWGPATYDGNSILTGGHPFYPNPTGTSTLMINALGGTIQPGELIMHKNWIRGGAVGVNSLGVPSAWLSDDGITDVSNNWFLNDQGYGTNNRWVGKVSQVINIHDNYAWNLGSPLDTSTAVSPKVNA